MTVPLVDVVIPLHRRDRPVDVAIDSARSDVQGVPTRVILVLHNLDLDDVTHARLSSKSTIISCADGFQSPSGPRNAGLDVATAPFVFFLDSDDALAVACLRKLYDTAVGTGADVVLPSVLGGDGYLGTPLAFSRTHGELDVVRDGLFFRSHSFALLRRSYLSTSGVRFPEEVRTGQDLVFMAQLYAAGRTAMALDAVYLLNDHGGERITTTCLPPADQLAAVRAILSSQWFRELRPEHRDALVHRIVVVNLASGWRRRRRLGHDPSREDHIELLGRALACSSDELRLLSVRDRITIRFTESPGVVEKVLLRKPFGLVPTSLSAALKRQGPLVSHARAFLARRRPRRLRRRSGWR